MRRNHEGTAIRHGLYVLTAATALLAPQVMQARGAIGPIAISMKNAREALVLQSDGRVLSMETSRRGVVERYRVPLRFQAMDLAVAGYDGGPEFCVTVNGRTGKEGSFLLQVMPDKREVWTHLGGAGLLVGVAVDAARRVAYVTKPFENTVYRVPLGEEKARPVEVATFALADRIGPAALDAGRQRLFVADMDGSSLFIVALATGSVQRVALSKVSEVRGLAWSASSETLYLADSGREAVWAVDIARNGRPSQAFKDTRFGDPSGLAMASDNTLWLVDEEARTAFQLALTDRRVLSSISLAAPAAQTLR